MEKKFNFDLLGVIKYLYKLLREQPRRKLMLYSSCLALISGYLLFCKSFENTLVILFFMLSASTALYNISYPVYMYFHTLFTKRKK